MKKLIKHIISFALILSLCPLTLTACNQEGNESQPSTLVKFTTPSTPDARNEEGKYLILNKDGSYGGTINDACYGKGAPLNGEYDVENSDYYYNGDYYNMKSNSERTIFPKFSPYQQTMQDSSGIACILMVLNYLGYDVKDKYSELNLVAQYERKNQVEVYGNGTTPEGLVKLIKDLKIDGLDANCTEFDHSNFSTQASKTKYTEIADWLKGCIKDGKFVLFRFQSPNGYGYKMVIGYDDKGLVPYSYDQSKTRDVYQDDFMILAEPNDNYDHFQDGFVAHKAINAMRWWFDKTPSAEILDYPSYVVIDPNIDVEFPTEEIDKTKRLQTIYENHLPRNNEGACYGMPYGGTRNHEVMGYVSNGGGLADRFDLPYTKFNDFYNMGSEGTRVMLPNYTVLQQTMSSSCGVCSITGALKYYGDYKDTSHFDFELEYCEMFNANPKFDDIVYDNGSSVENHEIMLGDLGYVTEMKYSWVGSSPAFESYESYASYVKYHLTEGRPVITGISTTAGHYVTIIGYDDMGTPEHIYDDVFVIADSSEYWDGYQDGYTVYSAYQIHLQHSNGPLTQLYITFVIYKK